MTLAADDIGRWRTVTVDIPKISRPVDSPAPRPNLEPAKRYAIERIVETIRKSIGNNPNVTLRPPKR